MVILITPMVVPITSLAPLYDTVLQYNVESNSSKIKMNQRWNKHKKTREKK
jgi:hypothetical protein